MESIANRLALGGAQLGMHYGISNIRGQPSAVMVEEIVGKARQCGISLIDTAATYGDSEALVGRVRAGAAMRIVTKTLPIRAEAVEQAHIADVAGAFQRSLQRLDRERVYGLLVHGAHDLLTRGGERLWAWLESKKEQDRVEKIGVSVYSPEELETLLERFPSISLVQLPFSIYDQRFLRKGLLDVLKVRHIEVHSRSAFLQGILLMPAERLPDRFAALRIHQARLHAWLAECGLTPLAGALAVCLNDSRVDAVVVGCETAQQLDEIASAACTAQLEADGFAVGDENLINPTLWGQRT